MKIVLNTITPLHVGSGEDLHQLDYVFDKNTNIFYKISQKLFFQFLKSYPDLINIYNEWINEYNNKIGELEIELEKNKKRTKDISNQIWKLKKEKLVDKIKELNNQANEIKEENEDYNQQLSKLKKEFNLLNFASKNKFEKDFIEFLNQNASEKTKLNYTPELLSVRGLLKTGNQKLYIPGTTIKGAIRTALLYKSLSKNEKKESIKRYLSFQKDNKNKKYVGSNIETEFGFGCGFDDFDKKQNKKFVNYTNAQYDLLKLLTITDAHIIENETVIDLLNSNLFLVSKNKDGSQETKKQAGSPTLEVIKPNAIIEFEIDFNIDFLLSVKEKILNDAIGSDSYRKWIGIETKVNNFFNIEIKTLTKENLATKKNEVLNYILNSVLEFSEQQKSFDNEWFDNIAKNDFKNLTKNYYSIPDNKNLFRFGFGSGFAGTTEFLYFKENLEEAIEPILRNNVPKFKQIDGFPKSRLLVYDNNKLSHLGWCEILEPKLSNVSNKVIENVKSIIQNKTNLPTISKISEIENGKFVLAKITKIDKTNSQAEVTLENQTSVCILQGVKGRNISIGQTIIAKITSFKDNKINTITLNIH